MKQLRTAIVLLALTITGLSSLNNDTNAGSTRRTSNKTTLSLTIYLKTI